MPYSKEGAPWTCSLRGKTPIALVFLKTNYYLMTGKWWKLKRWKLMGTTGEGTWRGKRQLCVRQWWPWPFSKLGAFLNTTSFGSQTRGSAPATGLTLSGTPTLFRPGDFCLNPAGPGGIWGLAWTAQLLRKCSRFRQNAKPCFTRHFLHSELICISKKFNLYVSDSHTVNSSETGLGDTGF